MIDTPNIAARSPQMVEIEAGKTYKWCACGKSSRQPFCDGSHKGSAFVPVTFTAEKSGPVSFCMCKHSNKKPFCDGSHSKV